jgi:hypothetical protein
MTKLVSAVIAAVVLLVVAPSALADCEYCAGPGGNRYCKEVNSSHPSGNDDCRTGLLGECTYKGNSCSGGGANCTAGGICEEHQTLFGTELTPADGARPVEGEPALCRLSGMTIEA